MAWKFLNIGKANAEIERLSAQVATVEKERDEARTALETNSSEVTKEAEELQGQLTQANSTIATLNGEVTSLKGQAVAKDGEINTLKTQLSAKDDEIKKAKEGAETAASHKAAQITGAQGQPPVAAPVNDNPAKTAEKPGDGKKGLDKVRAAFKAQLEKSKQD